MHENCTAAGATPGRQRRKSRGRGRQSHRSAEGSLLGDGSRLREEAEAIEGVQCTLRSGARDHPQDPRSKITF